MWELQRFSQGVICHSDAKRAFINHDSFHIIDPDWGRITIKMAGHPPFGAQIILNGHEYVACQARQQKSPLQMKETVSPSSPSPRSCQSRRHLVRGPDYRALEPALRALDLQRLPVLRLKPGGAEAHPIPISVFDLPDGIQPEPDLPSWRTDGAGLSGPD